jgi:prepilin-type N-terminal cleavage/methylation domain-containing protein
MKALGRKKRPEGFTLIELLVALGIFLLVIGAAFTLLGSSQGRYQAESQVLTSFQEARLGLDQIVRDVNDAGFPPPTFFNANFPNLSANTPFAWGPGYAGNIPCVIGTGGGGTCATPGDFDLIIETNPNPQDPSCAPSPCQVQWIRYQLPTPPAGQVPTLMRGAVYRPPVGRGDPDAATSAAGVLAPFVQNVVNNSPNLQIGVDAAGVPIKLSTQYPAVFPGGAPVPIFQYICDRPSLSQSLPLPTAGCPAAAADNSPANIRDVAITLIVVAPSPDAVTQRARLVQLTGRGRRVNPNQ